MVYAYKGFLTPSFSALIMAVGIILVRGPSQDTHTQHSLTLRDNLESLEINPSASRYDVTALDAASLGAFLTAQK